MIGVGHFVWSTERPNMLLVVERTLPPELRRLHRPWRKLPARPVSSTSAVPSAPLVTVDVHPDDTVRSISIRAAEALLAVVELSPSVESQPMRFSKANGLEPLVVPTGRIREADRAVQRAMREVEREITQVTRELAKGTGAIPALETQRRELETDLARRSRAIYRDMMRARRLSVRDPGDTDQ